MEFRDRIKRAAEHAGVRPTQAAMAKSLGLSRQTVFQWFGGTMPEFENIALVAEKWGVSPVWLAAEQGEMVARPTTTGLSAEERDIIRFYRNAQPQRRRALYDMAKALGKVVVAAAFTIPPTLIAVQAIGNCVLCKIGVKLRQRSIIPDALT